MNPAGGRITSGIENNTLLNQTINFVLKNLPLWRDDHERTTVQNENQLNLQLCKFLSVSAAKDFPMVKFHHEEYQSTRRSIDFSVTPSETTLIETTSYTIYEPFLVMEGKRLPAPPPKKREREYVTGEKRSGGIQRFKLGVHGEKMNIVVMIGYIESDSWSKWQENINQWIDDLASGKLQDDCKWQHTEKLEYDIFSFCYGDAYKLTSKHIRVCQGIRDSITIYHLWVEMNKKQKSRLR